MSQPFHSSKAATGNDGFFSQRDPAIDIFSSTSLNQQKLITLDNKTASNNTESEMTLILEGGENQAIRPVNLSIRNQSGRKNQIPQVQTAGSSYIAHHQFPASTQNKTSHRIDFQSQGGMLANIENTRTKGSLVPQTASDNVSRQSNTDQVAGKAQF